MGLPMGCKAPELGSMRNAVTPWFLPLGGAVDPTAAAAAPPSLHATYKYFREGCCQAYWTFAGNRTETLFTSDAPEASTSYCVSSGPADAYRTARDVCA